MIVEIKLGYESRELAVNPDLFFPYGNSNAFKDTNVKPLVTKLLDTIITGIDEGCYDGGIFLDRASCKRYDFWGKFILRNINFKAENLVNATLFAQYVLTERLADKVELKVLENVESLVEPEQMNEEIPVCERVVN